jgi:hypothetical protein
VLRYFYCQEAFDGFPQSKTQSNRLAANRYHTGGAAAPPSSRHLDVEVLEDVTQMTLAIITAAAFGFPIHATYGSERHAHSPATPDPKEANGKEKGKEKKYQLSFTRCMEVVSQRTLTKVLLPAWALQLPVFGLREVGVAFCVRRCAAWCGVVWCGVVWWDGLDWETDGRIDLLTNRLAGWLTD